MKLCNILLTFLFIISLSAYSKPVDLGLKVTTVADEKALISGCSKGDSDDCFQLAEAYQNIANQTGSDDNCVGWVKGPDTAMLFMIEAANQGQFRHKITGKTIKPTPELLELVEARKEHYNEYGLKAKSKIEAGLAILVDSCEQGSEAYACASASRINVLPYQVLKGFGCKSTYGIGEDKDIAHAIQLGLRGCLLGNRVSCESMAVASERASKRIEEYNAGWYQEEFKEGRVLAAASKMEESLIDSCNKGNALACAAYAYILPYNDGYGKDWVNKFGYYTKACDLGLGRACGRVAEAWGERYTYYTDGSYQASRANPIDVNIYLGNSLKFYNRACELLSGKEEYDYCDKAKEMLTIKNKVIADWNNEWDIEENLLKNEIKRLKNTPITSSRLDELKNHEKRLKDACDNPQLPYEGAPERVRQSQKKHDCERYAETVEIVKSTEKNEQARVNQLIRELQAKLERLPAMKANKKPQFD